MKKDRSNEHYVKGWFGLNNHAISFVVFGHPTLTFDPKCILCQKLAKQFLIWNGSEWILPSKKEEKK